MQPSLDELQGKTEPTDPQTKSRLWPFFVLLGAVALFCAAVGVAATVLDNALDGSTDRTIEGSIGLLGAGNYVGTSECFGDGGYDDLTEGADVVVHDESGDIIATSSLGKGHEVEDLACEFNFVVENVGKAKFYTVEVSHRGELEFSHDEMEDKDWTVDATIGEFFDE